MESEIRYLKSLWFDVFHSTNSKSLAPIIRTIKNEFDYECEEEVTKESLLNHIMTIIVDLNIESMGG